MSIEVDPAAQYVYVTEDGLNGSSPKALIATRKALFDEEAHPQIVDALVEIIDTENSRRETLDRFKVAGRFLLGTHRSYVPSKLRVNVPFDALLYAEAEEPNDIGAFSVVRMATWVRQSVVDEELYLGERTPLEFLIDAALTDISQLDESKKRSGVPVNRLTRIKSFEEDDTGYVFGHKKELEVVAGLEIPDRLKGLLTFVTKSWHRSELEHAGGAVFAEVLDDLDDRHF